MYDWSHLSFYTIKALLFISGWLADRLLGDPEGWPHPVVGFGRVISLGEKKLNKGNLPCRACHGTCRLFNINDYPLNKITTEWE